MYTCRLDAARQQVACARFNGNTDAIIVLDNAHQIRGRQTARTRSLIPLAHDFFFHPPAGSRERERARRPRANSQQRRKSRIVSPPSRSRTASRGVIKYFETELCKCREAVGIIDDFCRARCVFAQAKQMQPAAIINGERLYFCASNFISPSVSVALKMKRFSAGLSKAFQTCYYSSGWTDE